MGNSHSRRSARPYEPPPGLGVLPRGLLFDTPTEGELVAGITDVRGMTAHQRMQQLDQWRRQGRQAGGMAGNHGYGGMVWIMEDIGVITGECFRIRTIRVWLGRRASEEDNEILCFGRRVVGWF
ncbi:hypothetical protein EJ08DRAFT_653578 [Tothia fuscella]|uniref:Uncharacterized protein n=1 Tax=Tothia fuscella TaxID=1048955 RepID=A0A9P4TTI5_9PEZI|nr:hypothetical protein EJ08DRAFT_653578 [Tothia fuscella]